jgi:hypothetical protein
MGQQKEGKTANSLQPPFSASMPGTFSLSLALHETWDLIKPFTLRLPVKESSKCRPVVLFHLSS